jgi:hypothetical protein
MQNQQAGGGRLYNQVSEVRYVGRTVTGRVRTEAAAGSNDVKRAIGAVHCSALLSKFCRFASVSSDFTDGSL